MRDVVRAAAIVAAAAAAAATLGAQRRDAFSASREHPAIAYAEREGGNRVSRLRDALERGAAHLAFDEAHGRGYLPSLLEALGVPAESQVLVFSETSQQAKQIGPGHPRAIYFDDSVAVGWVPGTEHLEIAAHDREQGVVFYTLAQRGAEKPRIAREIGCLLCHLSWDTLAVPGLMTLSTFPMSDDPYAYASGVVVDHRTPVPERWGGWYVTGRLVPPQHMGNAPVILPAAELAKRPTTPPKLESIARAIPNAGVYLTPRSDVAALLILNHQTRATNLLTWVGWETRVALAQGAPLDRVDDAVRELVDYFLFVDEAPLAQRIEGAPDFASAFAGRGPRDATGRSLRQLDLTTRLMRYPCSYMIYSAAFDALPAVAREKIYARVWRVLSGEEHDARYARLSRDDRRAVIEILHATKADLPAYFE